VLCKLWNLSDDNGEQHNLVADHPEIVERLLALLEKSITERGQIETLNVWAIRGIGNGVRLFLRTRNTTSSLLF
jgi:hypothetical protein